jgi:hypothetical protein
MRLQILIIVVIFVAALLMLPRTMENHLSKEWSVEKKKAWVEDAKANCKPKGHAMDRGPGGYMYMSEVLECPDGTLRIVWMD